MEYAVEEQVGLGTFGKVFRARHRETGVMYALKRVKMETEREGFPVTAVREAKLLECLSHPNILQLVRIIRSNRKEGEDGEEGGVFFVFPYYEYDLVGLMSKHRVSSGDARFILFSLLSGLAYLHENDIVHRDVKPSNILISHDGQVCLGDFGLAKSLLAPDYHTPRQLTNRVVTLWYRAPELLLGATQYDGKIDIWAAGCVLYEMLGDGTALFFGNDEFTVLEAIAKRLGKIPDSLGHLPWFGSFDVPVNTLDKDPFHGVADKPAKDLLNSMLQMDPKKRINAKEALQHPYFRDVNKTYRMSGLQREDSQHEFEVKKTTN